MTGSWLQRDERGPPTSVRRQPACWPGTRIPEGSVLYANQRWRLEAPLADEPHVCGPAALGLLGIRLDVKLDLLAFVQLIEGWLLDHAAVEEYILGRALRLDETEPSITNDAPDSAFSHLNSFLADAHCAQTVGLLRLDAALSAVMVRRAAQSCQPP